MVLRFRDAACRWGAVGSLPNGRPADDAPANRVNGAPFNRRVHRSAHSGCEFGGCGDAAPNHRAALLGDVPVKHEADWLEDRGSRLRASRAIFTGLEHSPSASPPASLHVS
jgi:hypothetical protein